MHYSGVHLTDNGCFKNVFIAIDLQIDFGDWNGDYSLESDGRVMSSDISFSPVGERSLKLPISVVEVEVDLGQD